MADIQLMGYTKDFPSIDLELKYKEPNTYDLALIMCHVEEAKKGMKVSKIHNTTFKGTSIEYVEILDEDDSMNYATKVQNMISEYKSKYGN